MNPERFKRNIKLAAAATPLAAVPFLLLPGEHASAEVLTDPAADPSVANGSQADDGTLLITGGETYAGIAARRGVSEEGLRAANSNAELVIGSRIKIPRQDSAGTQQYSFPQNSPNGRPGPNDGEVTNDHYVAVAAPDAPPTPEPEPEPPAPETPPAPIPESPQSPVNPNQGRGNGNPQNDNRNDSRSNNGRQNNQSVSQSSVQPVQELQTQPSIIEMPRVVDAPPPAPTAEAPVAAVTSTATTDIRPAQSGGSSAFEPTASFPTMDQLSVVANQQDLVAGSNSNALQNIIGGVAEFIGVGNSSGRSQGNQRPQSSSTQPAVESAPLSQQQVEINTDTPIKVTVGSDGAITVQVTANNGPGTDQNRGNSPNSNGNSNNGNGNGQSSQNGIPVDPNLNIVPPGVSNEQTPATPPAAEIPAETTYPAVLGMIQPTPEPAEVEALKGISVNSNGGLSQRSAGYDAKLAWLEENTKNYISPEVYATFESGGIDTSLASEDIFRSERPTNKQIDDIKCFTLHWTAGIVEDPRQAAYSMLQRDTKANVQLFTMGDGMVYLLTPELKDVAYHAGRGVNYDCVGSENVGRDLLDFTPQMTLSNAMTAVYLHRTQGMPLNRDIAAIEAMPLDQYHDFATLELSRDLSGSVIGHKEAPDANKLDPTSKYVNLVYKLAVQLNQMLDERTATDANAALVQAQTAAPGQVSIHSLMSPQAVTTETAPAAITSVVTPEHIESARHHGVEIVENGNTLLDIYSPLGRPLTINDSHGMARQAGYANGAIREAYIHQGWDIKANQNDPVFAPFTGELYIFPASQSLNAGMGNVAMLKAGDGTVVQLGHLGRFANNLKNGQVIFGGEQIGFVGSSGTTDGSPQLDLKMAVFSGTELRPFSDVGGDGYQSINPANYFDMTQVSFRYAGSTEHGLTGPDAGVQGPLRLSASEGVLEQLGLRRNNIQYATPAGAPQAYASTVNGGNDQLFSVSMSSLLQAPVVTEQQSELMRSAERRGFRAPTAQAAPSTSQPEVSTAPTAPGGIDAPSIDNAIATASLETIRPLLSPEILDGDTRTVQQAVEASLRRLKNPNMDLQEAWGDQIEPSDVYYIWRSLGASHAEAATYAGINGRETGWHEAAVGDLRYDETNQFSFGLGQIRHLNGDDNPIRDPAQNLNPVTNITHGWEMYVQHGRGSTGFKPWRSTLPEVLTVDSLAEAIRLPGDDMNSGQRRRVDERARQIAEKIMSQVDSWDQKYNQLVSGGGVGV